MYKYDTHIHTRQASACATASGKDQALAFKKAGYTGIIITDHFFRGNTTISHRLPWETRINMFCEGYEEAKFFGDKIGLQVFFGWEETFEDQDFLIYGLDKEWLLAHPEMEFWSIEQQFEQVNRAGGMVIHAHPFRNRPYISKIRLYPKLVNGVEVYNASNYQQENQNAFLYAKKYDLPITAGSDNHHFDDPHSGIKVQKPFNTIQDYIDTILDRERFEIIYN